MTGENDPYDRAGSWRELANGYLGTCVALAGGVLIGAVTIYLTASVLPTAVHDIGGLRLYSWNTTVFLIAQVVATTLVSQMVSRWGNVGSYLIGCGVFAMGSVACAVSPTMPALIVGRGVQGLAAGLLTGLGFALVHSALPRRLWAKGSALISAMFGVGNFLGPAVGGLFAQFGSWRLAFATLAVMSLLLAALVPRVLTAHEPHSAAPAAVPFIPLSLVVGAVGVLSIAGVFEDRRATGMCIALALILIATALWTDSRAKVQILPSPTYKHYCSLRWVYLTIAFLACGVAVETFLPLFGQNLARLSPLSAGFLAAALSFGWSASQIASSAARSKRTIRYFLVAGPLLLAGAFATLALLQTSNGSPAMALIWVPLLIVGGTGIGLAMPHLSVAAMDSTQEPLEGQKAGAAIATVLTMSTAFGAAIAGLLVNLGEPSMLNSARSMLLGLSAICALGVFTALRVNRLSHGSIAGTHP